MKRKPWQGKATKEDEGKELTAPCGCVFRATQGFWTRIETCTKHIPKLDY